MDFLTLFNAVARAARPAFQDYKDITDVNAPLQDAGLDSMDGMMIGVYMSEIYGIPDEIAKEMHPTTVQEFLDFINIHKTKDPVGTVEEVVKGVAW